MPKDIQQKSKSQCLVLSGGGAKGVYHIGAWRAFQELNIPVDAFVGSSIGAIMAAFLAQGAYDSLEELGRTIGIDSLISLPPELVENGEFSLDVSDLDAVGELLRSVFATRGFDTRPMRRILESQLSEARIRSNGKDLGIVTVNMSDLKPRELFIEKIPEGMLIDFLMASAAFPGFAQPVLHGKRYADGGLYDNIPFEMARKRGYRNIVVVDISGMGRNKKPDIQGTQTTYIRNSISMGGVLDFDRDFLDSFMELGYLDTLRTCGTVEGYAYFLKGHANKELENRAFEAYNKLIHLGLSVPEVMEHNANSSLQMLECAARCLEINRIQLYTYKQLYDLILETQKKEDALIADTLRAGAARRPDLLHMLRQGARTKHLDASPYFYYRLTWIFMPGTAGNVVRSALSTFVPELPAALIFLGQAV